MNDIHSDSEDSNIIHKTVTVTSNTEFVDIMPAGTPLGTTFKTRFNFDDSLKSPDTDKQCSSSNSGQPLDQPIADTDQQSTPENFMHKSISRKIKQVPGHDNFIQQLFVQTNVNHQAMMGKLSTLEQMIRSLQQDVEILKRSSTRLTTSGPKAGVSTTSRLDL